MKEKNNINKLVIFALCIITFLFVCVLISLDKTVVNIDCSVKDINLVDVSPDDCWNPNFSSTHCPIPKDIDCFFSTDDLENFIDVIE